MLASDFTWSDHVDYNYVISKVIQQPGLLPEFIQKIATIFQGLFKDHKMSLDFQGPPTRNNYNFTDSKKMHILSLL